MGKVYIFDGKKIHKVSPGALAMAIDLERGRGVVWDWPVYSARKERQQQDLEKEIYDLKLDLETKIKILDIRERVNRRLQRDLDEYDVVFKKYDLTMGVVLDTFNLLPVVDGVSIKQAVLQTILKIWKD